MITSFQDQNCLIYLIHGNDLLALLRNNLLSARNSHISLTKIAYINRRSVQFYTDTCREFDVEIVATDFTLDNQSYSEWGSTGFNEVTSYKWLILIDALKRGYKNAIYSDVDIAYIANFDEYINNISSQYKLGMQSESLPKYPAECCTGFMFFRSDTIHLLEQIVEINKANISSGNDQDIFNKIYSQNINIQKELFLFPEALFPNGLHYKNFLQDPYDPIRGKLQPFIFHANYVLGLEAKIALLKKVGLWLLP